ncbi:MAG: SEL1-like repeat protein [Rhodobacteraceae bacterium]|nr:SEL1-like repeat protein [Paracoccaceae bacterium]
MGCYYLGWNIRDGIGVPPDPGAALIHLRRGCELGGSDACAAAEALQAAD